MHTDADLVVNVHAYLFGYFQGRGECVGDRVFKNSRIRSAIDADFEVFPVNECRCTITLHDFMLDRPALYRSPVGLLSAYLKRVCRRREPQMRTPPRLVCSVNRRKPCQCDGETAQSPLATQRGREREAMNMSLLCLQ